MCRPSGPPNSGTSQMAYIYILLHFLETPRKCNNMYIYAICTGRDAGPTLFSTLQMAYIYIYILLHFLDFLHFLIFLNFCTSHIVYIYIHIIAYS